VYQLGACALMLEYKQVPIALGESNVTFDFDLGPEAETGQWIIIGSTEPELLLPDAPDIAILMSDGRIFYCHDTVDPLVFDPVTGSKFMPSASSSEQHCFSGSLLEDGRIIAAGGHEGSNFRDAIPWVKAYNPATNSWQLLPDMQLSEGRYYPGLARLADGSLLVMGGGMAPTAERTATCERFDLSTGTWSFTGSMVNPCDYPPCGLLFTGEVLATWWPPQLYNPSSGQWRLTGNFNQPNRLWPGHSDHSLVLLADGQALAIGVRKGPANNTVMGEIYDPATEIWSLTSNPGLIRSQAEVVQLPDGRILVAAGETEVASPPVDDVLGVVKWCDLYDPATDTWRRAADMNWFREYHSVTLLVPDGRVVITGGTRIKWQYGPTSADIEAYLPPYLFRGIRPQIQDISTAELARGCRISLTITPQTMITSIVLMGTAAHTHWAESGIPRRIVLPVQQNDSTITADIPEDPNILPLGHYMLFAMVDDIPSEAIIIRIKEARAPGDFDGDNDVDFADFALLAAFWRVTSGNDLNYWCGGADFVPDGDVDWDDLNQFVKNWLEGIIQ
jgi:hypothetical protein